MLRGLYWGALAVYGVAAIGLLGLRYWVLPRVDQWRPQIEAYASQALGAQVSIGAIQANWQGLNPRLDLASVQVHDGAVDAVLTLPKVSAVLAWRSILTLSPRLLQLRLDQPELNLRRDAQNRLWVAGMAIDLNDQGGPAPGLEHPALRWLTSQRELLIHGAVIRWQDELRQAPELTLRDVEFLARNGRLSHRFALRASAGEALARQLDLRAEFNRGLFSGDAGNPANWSGQIYLQADDLEPLAWSAWLPALPVAGRLSWPRLAAAGPRQVHRADLRPGRARPVLGGASRRAGAARRVRAIPRAGAAG
ncbi:hypothetical protein WJ970_16420 [Achromobacter xylosoxidans]